MLIAIGVAVLLGIAYGVFRYLRGAVAAEVAAEAEVASPWRSRSRPGGAAGVEER